jgi:hypothetical protein
MVDSVTAADEPIGEQTATDKPASEAQSGAPKQLVSVEFEKLTGYIETDLWSRFQARLWKVVAAFLTVVAIAGFLGIPYYIKSEISARLESQAKTFGDRVEEIAAYSKLSTILQSQYDSALYGLRSDADVAIIALQGKEKEAKDQKRFPSMNSPSALLNQLMSEPDLFIVTNGGIMATQIFHFLSQDQLKIQVALPKGRIIENAGISGSGGYGEPHPVLDGTLGGILQDLKFRIAVLVSLHDSIRAVDEALLRAGDTSDIEKRIAAIKVTALQGDIAAPAFRSKLKAVLDGQFLSQDDKDKFEKARRLYLPPPFLDDDAATNPNRSINSTVTQRRR